MTTAPSQQMTERVASIQAALRDQKIDGWLFYDFWKRNEYAQRILDYPKHILNTRRFFYLIPAQGEPRKLVHSIERWNLDHLPGEKAIYLSWQSLSDGVTKLLSGMKTIAMERKPSACAALSSRHATPSSSVSISSPCAPMRSGTSTTFL